MKKGFTLIELLVVVLIIGILSAIALPQYIKAVEKARASEAIQLLGDLANAERIFHMTTGAYTDNMELLDMTMPGIVTNTPSQARTNHFNIQIHTATDSQFVASASRANNGTIVGNGSDQQYAIMAGIDSTGALVRWCNTTAAATIPHGIGNQTIENKTCKSIANNTSGQIK